MRTGTIDSRLQTQLNHMSLICNSRRLSWRQLWRTGQRWVNSDRRTMNLEPKIPWHLFLSDSSELVCTAQHDMTWFVSWHYLIESSIITNNQHTLDVPSKWITYIQNSLKTPSVCSCILLQTASRLVLPSTGDSACWNPAQPHHCTHIALITRTYSTFSHHMQLVSSTSSPPPPTPPPPLFTAFILFARYLIFFSLFLSPVPLYTHTLPLSLSLLDT